jgi:hypothetical protein
VDELRLFQGITRAAAFADIIEKNELWATSAYFLNDSAEITYSYGVLKEVLDDWLAKNLSSVCVMKTKSCLSSKGVVWKISLVRNKRTLHKHANCLYLFLGPILINQRSAKETSTELSS